MSAVLPAGTMARVRVLLFTFSAAFAPITYAQIPGAAPATVHVIHYDARVEPDIARQTVTGTVALRFIVSTDNQDRLELDRGSLTVDAVREAGRPQPFTQSDRLLHI